MLLPILGGSPSVWNTAMVFYQAALLGGYLYAHLISKVKSIKVQFLVHGVLLLLPLLVLPLYYGQNLKPPTSQSPVGWMLLTMATTVGLPFFVLSASSPLVQRWFNRLGGKDPYFLYAASNVGSFVGLLTYPFFVEPKLGVHQQSSYWTAGFIGLVLLFTLTMVFGLRKGSETIEEAEDAKPETISWQRRLRWLFLAFVPSSHFIGVTTFLTSDIASMPLLWVIPLAIYLLSMILVFAKKPPIPHKFIVTVAPFVLAGLVFLVAVPKSSYSTQIADFLTHQRLFGMHLIFLFFGNMLCHGELAKDRPKPVHLTEFFLIMSCGGVLGGIFNALVAPVLFVKVIEYTLILAVVGTTIPARVKGFTHRLLAFDIFIPCLIFISVYGAILLERQYGLGSRNLSFVFLMAVGTLASLLCLARPLRFGLALVAILLLGNYTRPQKQILFEGRSFFGVHKVEKNGQTHSFMNGTILHGRQTFLPEYENRPNTYYHYDGPLKEILGTWPRPANAKVAMIGLGVGTSSLWSRPGENWTFYEIDPMVEDIARNPKYFTALSLAKGNVNVVIGDARVKLAESPDKYDVILVDAFSSDSIPVHLLTYEAVQLYQKHLTPNGVLAIHISNRYLRLEPVIAALGEKMGWRAFIRNESEDPPQPSNPDRAIAVWTALAPRSAPWDNLISSGRWAPAQKDPRVEAWTDDFSSLMPILK